MKKTKYSTYFVFISVFTFLSLLVMVVQKGYTGLINKDIQTKYSQLLNPINPNLNSDIINEIESKKEYLGNNRINVSTESGRLTPTPVTETVDVNQPSTASSVINTP